MKNENLLEVIKMGHPVLRQEAVEISKEEIANEKFQYFIDILIQTMREHDGAGIAAPQVGILKRIFVMEMEENTRYPDKESFPLEIVINPIIKAIGNTVQDSWEGCLSIPGIRGRLKRFETVELSGLDRNGNAFKKTLTGFASVVAQHELDHLDGKLFIDRMESMETLSFQEEYETFWL